MNAVFADTYYYLALLNSADPDHFRARQFSNSFFGRVYTTDWVLTELADAFAPVRTRRTVTTFIDVHRNSRGVTVIGADKTLFARGWNLYSTRPDKSWSLTDCISFDTMATIGITDALTGDHHFEQAGFRALPKRQFNLR